MSITFGIYDFFSFMIPGFLYLYVIYDGLQLSGIAKLDFTKLIGIPEFIILAFLSYIVGHLMDIISLELWYKRLKRHPSSGDGLQQIKNQSPSISIKFEREEWAALFYILHQRDYSAIQTIDKYKADALMMRNLSFGFFLLALVKTVSLFILKPDQTAILILVVSILFSIATFRRSMRYDAWYYRAIFGQALAYGTSLKDVIAYKKQKSSTEKQKSNKTTKKVR